MHRTKRRSRFIRLLIPTRLRERFRQVIYHQLLESAIHGFACSMALRSQRLQAPAFVRLLAKVRFQRRIACTLFIMLLGIEMNHEPDIAVPPASPACGWKPPTDGTADTKRLNLMPFGNSSGWVIERRRQWRASVGECGRRCAAFDQPTGREVQDFNRPQAAQELCSSTVLPRRSGTAAPSQPPRQMVPVGNIRKALRLELMSL